MKTIEQRRLFSKENGTHGDCMQCCVAMLLGLEYQQVPDFISQEFFWDSFYGFIRGKGFEPKERSFLRMKECPTEFCIMTGETVRTEKTGVKHSVIYRNGELFFDPHPSKAGLSKPEEYFFLEPL
jgi:hypothetical protein